MNGYVCLLRGINVGGANKIKMAELRTLLSSNKFSDVTTYIQSGNILFKSEIENPSEIAELIKSLITKQYGYNLSVMILTIKELDFIFKSNPFLSNEPDLSKLLVTTFNDIPSKEGVETILEFVSKLDDHLFFNDRFMFLHCPNGYGKTKLTSKLLEKKLKTSGTTRNWKTITKLIELSENYR